MKKIYITLLSAGLLLSHISHAQQREKPSIKFQKTLGALVKSGQQFRTNADCDTINLPAPPSWNPAVYGVSQNGGFLTGTNRYGDLEKAAFFDLSGTANTYLTKVFIYIAVANTNTPANLTKVVPIHVYNADEDGPTTLITTVNMTLAQIKEFVDADKFVEVAFPGGVLLPASKQFFISVDISNLTWNNSSASAPKDSLAVVSTSEEDVLADDNGYFYERWDDDSWNSSDFAYNIDFALAIFPIVGNSTECGTLPITLASFTGEKQGTKNILKWITLTEQNNKGFELERSVDGVHFSSLGFVSSKGNSGNSTTTINYAFSDVKPFSANSYYRLKQVDKDGKFKLSSVVMIKGLKVTRLELGSLYPNPTRAFLNLVVSSPANEKINIVVSDLAGKLVMQQAAQMQSGDNNLQLNVAKLPAGSYMIKAVCSNGCETAVTKFVKQ